MPEEPTDPELAGVMRGLLAALERRDFEHALSYFAPDPVWDMSAVGMGTFAGADALRGLFEDWSRPYEEWEAELEGLLDLGRGVVAVEVSEQGCLLGSSARVQLRYAVVAVLAGTAIVRVSSHRDIDEARGAGERAAAERS
jgi:ketosteroid isomerase-like protein